jgi:hypothetical protein
VNVVISNEGGSLSAHVKETSAGKIVDDETEAVVATQYDVRANMTADLDDMNQGELLIEQASMLSKPEFKGLYSAGFDLSMVRSVTVYALGPKTNMGQASVVEARDAGGKNLGSFFGGFIVSPCAP